LVREVKMPQQIVRAIEDKQAMEQAALKKEYELTLATKEAERLKLQGEGIANQKIAVADGEAQAQIARAKGEAESKKIIAEGEAQALKAVAEVINSNPAAYDFKKLQVTQELYKNPNTKFIALPSDDMIFQLPDNLEA
jgi:regulator of protease activity HflC (stomatin/prohibitin superfamily)